MKIMTARKLAFYSPDRQERFISKGGRIIEDCPEWAVNDAMFKAAEKAGILTRLMDTTSTKEEVKIQEAAPANAHEVKAEVEEPVKVKATKKTSKKK